MRSSMVLAFVVGCAAALPLPGFAQTFPSRQVTIVVNSAAGGTIDLVARSIKDGMQEALGQSVVIENRPTGGGLVGIEQVKRATPDGHTLLFTISGPILLSPMLNKAAKFDSVNDFSHVSLVAEAPAIFSINAKIPAKTLPEFVALAKADPGKYSYTSTGIGSPSHLMGEILKKRAGIEMVHVPYQGSPHIAVQALVTGEVHAYGSNPIFIFPHAEAGTVRILAHTINGKGEGPLASIPNVFELGYPELAVPAWFGLLAPAGTPKPIVDTLNTAVRRTLERADAREMLAKGLNHLKGSSPEEFRAIHVAEFDRWSRILKEMGMHVQ